MNRRAAPLLPKVVLGKDLRLALHRGSPWLYRDALEKGAEVGDGAIVLVCGRDRRPIGRGFWASEGPIAVRMLTTNKQDEIAELVGARLEAALAARAELLRGGTTTAFRWVHGEGDRLPGVHVDVYGPYVSAVFDGAAARSFYLAQSLPVELVLRGASLGIVTVLERRGRGAAAQPLVGDLPAGDVEVREHGLVYSVDLVRGQKGGLFLDQRENRLRVRSLANGRRVLNLFGYTGGFSLNAALGGAAHTTTVDAAPAAIEAARRNFARNAETLGPAAQRAAFVVADAFEFLEAARSRKERWQLVISDPPSFAPSERARPAALGAYRRLHALCAAVTAPGGVLCAASCSSHVGERDFVGTVTEGARDAGRRFALEALHGAASDHPVRPEFPQGRYLEFAIGSVA